MYELLIKLYYELDYKKYNIEDLKEIKDILNKFNKNYLQITSLKLI